MIGETAIRRTLEQALAISSADQTEALIMATESNVTRFANSTIHQNTAEKNVELRVRVVFGRRIGVASTSRLTRDGIVGAVEAATELAKLSGESRDFVSLPEPEPVRTINCYVRRTANCPPRVRSRLVQVVCRRAKSSGLSAAGALSTVSRETAVANSLGVFAYHPASYAEIVAVAMSDDSSGYAERASTDISSIDVEAVAEEATSRALRSRRPTDLEPGEYEVVLEEYAVHDVVEHVASLGFNALAYQEGESFVVGRLGEPLTSGSICLWDDGLDEDGIPQPFDFEGVPKRRVDLLENGRAMGLVYDSFTAGREGKHSTGHALPAPNSRGPLPTNLFLGTGGATKEEMIADTKRGILVTRFHYTNPADRKKAVITGMTRDGTFLIENGEVTRPLRNLRFTQSYLEALSHVEMIGKTSRLHLAWMGAVSAPALKISRWSFQQATLY